MKKLFLFVLFLLSLFALSCNNNVLKPSDYSKEEINKKYPYWQVGVANFQIANNLPSYATITVEEKRFILRCMALIRTALNSDEFLQAVRDKGALTAASDYSYGNFSIKAGAAYDPDKLTEVVRTVKHNFTYEKLSTGGAGLGTVGVSRYVRYCGGQPADQIPTADWVGFENDNWIKWSGSGNSLYGYSSFASLMFHEHMHNIGFTHNDVNKDSNVPYGLQDVVQKLIYRILNEDLKDKYAKQLDELTAYYFTEYKDLLLEDSVFDPSKK
ncbi:hypothetical protein OFR22_10210 [Brachyspira hyodysenteriae]|uniref:hypothetical protein n=1 Tax=Brachyspira hyodysenteriae TaxID=159 RepID=UPI00063DA623|nr:hypothetical protein [Brachyspira hyodysenteriae]KLI26222.1 hypothetical protein SU43_01285 [Brachyspira hyodysenteriae]MCZ9851087.1 hypothetical protein [Brachyspira hyodysenteriae]MCZ9860161.1 hypothetical protein [Brachyspira hyodysenteriae]MCZ9869557.1 hypothetical protein [Brachyspira hyodysenteriae]MCZ9878911.1 hypothetical protein [Brachyspira hyodysenteriae]